MMQLMRYMLIPMVMLAYPLQGQLAEPENARELLHAEILKACREHPNIGIPFGASDEYRESMQSCVTAARNDLQIRTAMERIAAGELAQWYMNSIIRLRTDTAIRFVDARRQLESIIGAEVTRQLIIDQKNSSTTPQAYARLERATSADARVFRELETALRMYQDALAGEDLARRAIQTYLSAEGLHIEDMSKQRKEAVLNDIEAQEKHFAAMLEGGGELEDLRKRIEKRQDAIPEIAEAKATFSLLREEVGKRLAFERAIASDVVESTVRSIEF